MRIALVSPFFDRASPTEPMPSVSLYTEHLLDHFPMQSGQHTVHVLSTFARSADTASDARLHRRGRVPFVIHRCFGRGLTGLWQLWRSIRRGHYDIVHLQHETFLYGGVSTLIFFPVLVGLLRLCTAPIVTLHHIVDPLQVDRAFAVMNHSRLPAFLIRSGYRLFYRLLGSLASSIVVHEEGFKEILVRAYAIAREIITVIPHGILNPLKHCPRSKEHPAQRFGMPDDAETVFGFFGYVSGYKGIDLLLQAFHTHVARHPHSHLLIGGSVHPGHRGNPTYDAFLASIQRLAHVTPNVHWLGGVPDKDVGAFFDRIDCLVLPYRSCFGQSGPLSYAIGADKPFIASTVLRPIVPFDVLLFPPTRQGLMQRLDAFVETPVAGRMLLHDALRDLSEERSWDHVAAQTFALYQHRTMQRHSHPRILLLGAYGQQNLGDELLLGACLEHLPRSQCLVASADPARTEHEHGVLSLQSHRGFFHKLIAVLRARTIIVGGGDQFKVLHKSRDRHPYALLLQYAAVALLAKVCGKKFLFLGVGIGTIDTPLARMLTRFILSFSHVSTFRDRESALLAHRLAPHAQTFLASDLAFLLPPPDTTQRESRPLHCLGIAPVAALDHPAAYARVMRSVGQATDCFLGEDPKHHTLFLPFQTGFNTHDDIRTTNDILHSVTQTHRCHTAASLSWESAHATYQSLDVLWGMRLHSLILACLHSVPFIALIYDVKVRNFLREIDYVDFGIELDASFSAEKLMRLQKHLQEQASEIRRHLRAQSELLFARSSVNADMLASIGSRGRSHSTDHSSVVLVPASSPHNVPHVAHHGHA